MKSPGAIAKGTTSIMLTCFGVMAAAQTTATYNEPTRGFMLERGSTANNQDASIDLSAGGGQDFSGGVRLGLPGSELILNHNRLNPSANTNEAIFKFGMPPLSVEGNTEFDWSLYGGLSHFDPDNGDSTTNVGFGGAITANVENFILNFNPEFILDDSATGDASDAFLNLGFGAHYSLPATDFGRFEPGLELNLTTRDDVDGESIDPSIMLGTRWLYNDNVTLDFAVVNVNPDQSSDGQNQISVPGFVRLNIAF